MLNLLKPVNKIISLTAAVALLSFVLPNPHSRGQTLPEQPNAASPETPGNAGIGGFLNILFLSEPALCKSPEEIAACAQRLLDGETDKVSDPVLRRKCVFALAKIAENPEKLEEIRAEHLRDLGEHFTETAITAREGKRLEDALAASQIALKCDPANIKARLLFASLIEPKKALQTLHYGIKFLKLDSELAPVYFNRYFDTLADLQQDRIAAKQASSLLKMELPGEVHRAVANHAAISFFWIGDYERSLQILEEENIADTQQGMILKSRCLFELGEISAAVKLLENGLSAFPPEKRDVILSQLSHYHQQLGDWSAALKTADRRIAENPDSATPFLQRLFLYHKTGDKKRFQEELESIFENFSSSQTALLSLANLAAETGRPDIADRCMRRAVEQNIAPGMFVAAEIEAVLTSGDAGKAILDYAEISKANPKLFDAYEKALTVILAAAYARAGTDAETDEEKTRLREHSQALLSQYLAEPGLTPEEFLSAIGLMRRIKEFESAQKLSEAALAAFPWHSQLRAETISLRIKLNLTEGSADRTALDREIQVLTQMRRPNPKIWQEISDWLATTKSIPANRAAALKKAVAPLVKKNYHDSRDF